MDTYFRYPKRKHINDCCIYLQECFDAMKGDIVDKMKMGIDESLKKDFGACKLDENTRDIFRAFKMIISQFSAEKVKQKMKVNRYHLSIKCCILFFYHIRFQKSIKRCLILCGL